MTATCESRLCDGGGGEDATWHDDRCGDGHRRVVDHGYGYDDDASASNGVAVRRHFDLLILQCHSVGALWNGLLPLLFPKKMTTTTSMTVGGGVGARHSPISLSSYHFAGPYYCSAPHERPMEKEQECENDDHGAHHDCRNEHVAHSMARRCRRRRRRHNHRGREGTSTKIAPPSAAARALSVLMKNFENHVRGVRLAVDDGDDDDNDGDADVPMMLLLLPPDVPLLLLHDEEGHTNERRRYYHIHHYYSRNPSNAPDNAFALRLLTSEKNLIRLSSLSAYISTLGGGFFLCRYLSTAISLARRQCAIALMRDDIIMALKCRINEGYCYIHAGRLNRGRRVIRRVLRDVTKMQSDIAGDDASMDEDDGLQLNHTPEGELSDVVIVRNMCRSALRFAELIREASSSSTTTTSEFRRGGGIALRNDDRGGERRAAAPLHYPDGTYSTKIDENYRSNEVTTSTTHDDYQRIRIVRDRRWR